MSLNTAELNRYTRHINLPEFGEAGQLKLKHSRVLVVGAGGLGCPALLYLSAAGIGTLGIVDHDTVAESNLQRQILFKPSDLGFNKAVIAKQYLAAQNPHIKIQAYDYALTTENVFNLFAEYDLILDCSDNFATRYLINDACCSLGKPYVFASIAQFEGLCAIFATDNGPCYRCLHDVIPDQNAIPNCAQAGVLGVLPGLLGVLQATEALKLISSIGEPLIGKLLKVDSLTMNFQVFNLPSQTDCPSCGKSISFKNLTAQTGDSNMLTETNIQQVTPAELKQFIANDEVFILDVREPHEYEAFNIGGYLIPPAQLEERINEINTDKLIVVHCHVGPRAIYAIEILKKHGIDNVANLQGGMVAWQQASN